MSLARAPQTRDIHIEAYRYGFSPSRIKANRGDRLRLTFSTRDTGQSFFFQDYDLHVSITPGNKMVSVQRLSHPDDPPALMETVEIVAGLPGWQGWLVSKSQFRNHTYNGPLHGTERGELDRQPQFPALWSPGAVVRHSVGGIAVDGPPRLHGLPIAARSTCSHGFPWLKRVLKAPSFQFNLALPMLGVFWFIILAGLFGTKVAGRNAGPMIIWVLWLSGLIILLVPLGGRIWCTACPLPLLGEWLQRLRLTRNPAELEDKSPRRIFGIPLDLARLAEQRMAARAALPAVGDLQHHHRGSACRDQLDVDRPCRSWPSSLPSFREQRLFCRHLCPINSYISLYSTTGRVMVRSVSSQTCADCDEQFCLTGSVKGWGCPYGLCVGEIDRNNDCGACMECVKTCAYDNVAVFWRSASGWDNRRRQLRRGLAGDRDVCPGLPVLLSSTWAPGTEIRDWIDIVDKGNWGTFAVYAVVVWAVVPWASCRWCGTC